MSFSVDIVVPTMSRKTNPPRLAASLGLNDGHRCRLWFVAEADGDEQARICAKAGADNGIATTVLLHSGSFPVKVNHAWRTLEESDHGPSEWFMPVGDDVVFQAGWLDAALRAAEARGWDVVGTNDLLNPRVTAGIHAIHPLIRSSYIRDQGASWDGPGVVCSEAYRHNFCDDEWTRVAQDRGVFGVALDSVVEHMHALNGKASIDDYEVPLSIKIFRDDAKIFVRREHLYANRSLN